MGMFIGSRQTSGREGGKRSAPPQVYRSPWQFSPAETSWSHAYLRCLDEVNQKVLITTNGRESAGARCACPLPDHVFG